MKKIILLFILIAVKQLSFSQCLNGIYTIGGASPSYTSITQAVNTLTLNGVCGPVTFNIRPGTYNERITMPVVAGTSSVNTIVFQSETADSSSTIIQVVGNSSQNYVVKLDGTDFVTVKNITLKNTDANYMCLVHLINGVVNFNLSNCVIDAPTTASILPNANRYLINSASNTNVNCIIKNNKITGGQRAIYVNSNSALITDFRILNNVFLNQYEHTISLSGVRAPKIISNKITYSLSNTAYKGMNISSSNDVIVIERNTIEQTLGEPITIYFATGNMSNYSSVSNNKINVLGGSTGSTGIYLQNASYVNVFHNTIVSVNTNTASSCISLYTNTNVNTKNNILYHKGSGLAYYIANSLASATFDYNDVYVTGANFAYNISGFISNFNNWKTLGYDYNSLNYIPQFVSISDFHIASDFSQNLPMPFMPSVPIDIEGTLRDNVSPYFGAYEYANTLNVNDASVNKIYTYSITCIGNNSVKVLLKNLGSSNLTSTNINWSVNGAVQTPYSWTGNLGFYDTTSLAIGNYNFANLGTYTISAWTSLPNNVVDNLPINDSAKSSPIKTSLNGIYTIGGASPTYTNLVVAINDLKLRGLCGNVTFNIRPGFYSGNYTLTAIPGLSGSNSLTIQSENGVNSSVSLSESDVSKNLFTSTNIENFVLKNVSISNSANNVSLLNFAGRAINIEISGCVIYSIKPSSAIYFLSGADPVQNISVNNNNFLSGSSFLTLVNTSGSNATFNVKIFNNTINSNSGGGTIDIYEFDSLEIKNNIAVNTNSWSPSISIQNANYVKLLNNKAISQDVSGITLSNVLNAIVANNMVSTSGTSAINAVSIDGHNNLHFINNSIHCRNTNINSYALALTNYVSGSVNRIWNNIISNSSVGKAIKLTTFTNILPGLKSNDYYTTGITFGNYNSSNIASLNLWKTTINTDTNSILINPQFYSATDLHANEISINNAGVSVIPDITTDFDGQTRNTSTPDIGADEFTPLTIDAGTNGLNFGSILCAGTNPIQVLLKNNGTTTLTSASLGCKINTTTIPTFNWTGSLASGSQTLVTIGSYSFAFNTNYTIKAWSSLPNSTSDAFRVNDTTYQTYSNAGMSGVFTIGGSSPTYTSIGSAVTALINGGVCGPVIFNIRDGIYNEQIKIPNIKGVSSTNTILFQSQSLDSSLVTIQYSGTSTLNYVATVDSTDYITFNKLGFKALNLGYANVFTFTNRTTHVQIKNCSLIGQQGSGTLISMWPNCDSVLISNNRFYKGQMGISINAVSNKVLNNYFEDQSQNSISGNGLNLDYSSNKFTFSAANNQAININGVAGGKISKNKITYTANSFNGLTVLNAGSVTNPLYITNNFISLKGGDAIKLNNLQYCYLINNSINQIGNGTCLTYTTINNSVSQNNIFYSESGYCINASASNPSFSTNYNCIYSPVNNLINVNGMPYTVLSAYTATTSMEANSVSTDPLYNTNVDLHVANSAGISGTGLYNANAYDDIDGDARSLTTPDMGADEFVLLNIGNDAQVLKTYVSNSGCGGAQTLYAKIKNIGTSNLTTVQLSAKVGNNIVSPVTWNGNLAQGQTKDSISLGTVSNLYGNTNIKAWTFLPNGSVDGNFVNDTVVYQLPNTALKGNYKIGGTSPDFVSLRTAKNALVSYGVCGAVVFDLRPGTYQDTLTIPSVVGSSTLNTITFQSENGDSSSVIITDFAAAPVIYPHYIVSLNNLGNVIFSKLTFQQLITSHAFTGNTELIFIKPGALSTNAPVTIKNCRFLSNSFSRYSIYVDGTNSYNIKINILNNYLFGGDASVYLFQGYINSSVLIKDNYFHEQGSMGSITLRYLYGVNHLIEGNTIESTNLINKTNISTDADVTIRNNKVKTFNATVISASGALKLYNNYFLVRKITNTNIYGLYFNQLTASSHISNNTIIAEMLGTYPLMYLYNNTTTIKNNIINNPGNGRIYDVNLNNTLTITNNRYGSVGPLFGSYLSSSAPNLQAWKILTGFDANSQNQITYFLNDSTYKVIGDFDLNNHALPIAGITTDIENNIRNASTPDIGAYEFNLVNNDAGITRFVNSMDSVLCTGNNSISLMLKNFGANTLSSIDINWKLNGLTQPLYNWSGTIAPGDSSVVVIGSANLLGGQTNKFMFYTSNPNGTIDVSNINDTLKTNGIKTRLSGIYTIGGALPNYITLKQATDSLQKYGVCGPVTYNIRSGVYTSRIILNAFQGSSQINLVTFQSEGLDSSLVLIKDSILQFDGFISGFTIGASNIVLNKLSFSQNSILNISSLDFRNTNKNITISNCDFKHPNNTVTSYAIRFSISADTSSLNYNVTNNYFHKFSALYFSYSTYPYSSNKHPKKIVINANYFDSTYVAVSNYDSLVISNNVVNEGAIDISKSKTIIDIFNNRITRGNLSLSYCNAINKKVYNNLFDNVDIFFDSVPNLEFYHNTVNKDTHHQSLLEISGGVVNQKIKNNIFYNSSVGKIYRLGYSYNSFNTPNNCFDFNIIYAPNDSIMESQTVSNHQNWQTQFRQDEHSLFLKPTFASLHDFHIINDHQLNNMGSTALTTLYDFDGVLRNTSTPDIGAYEFNGSPTSNDAGILNVVNNGTNCDQSSSPVTVTLKNNGINNLTNVIIKWKFNGISQPDFVWNGNLSSNAYTLVTIGSYTSHLGSNNNNLIAYTSLPNGNIDSYLNNDTLIANLGYPMLNGIYSVGGMAANFNTLSDALVALSTNGVCGPVDFKFNPGTYDIVSPASGNLSNIPGNSVLNTITFESANGNNSSVVFNGTGFALTQIYGLTFKNITLKQNLINIGLNCKSIKFEGNHFDSHPSPYQSGQVAPIYSNQYHEDVSIINNNFSNCEQDFIQYTHTFGSQYPKRVIIKGNVFTNPGLTCIDIMNVDSLIVDSNTFYRSSLNNISNSQAVRILQPRDYFKISRNKVSGTFESCIYVFTKSGNHIGKSSIENNVVIGSMYTHGGISSSCDSVSLLYNTVHMRQSFPGYGAMSAGNRNKVYNNILSSNGTMLLSIGTPSMTYSDYNVFYSTSPGIITYYNGGTQTVTSTGINSYTATTGLEIHSIVASPQFINDTLDLHYQNHLLDGKAIPIPTVLIDQQNKPRHLTTPNPGAYEAPPDTTIDNVNKYLSLKSIQTSTLVVGVNNAITASVYYTYPMNTDTNVYKYRGTIDSLRIHYQVNNQPEVIEKWHGTLNLHDSLTYTFTNQFFVPNGKLYSIKVWFENLNSNNYEVNVTDDSLIRVINLPMQGDYTVGGLYPDFVNFDQVTTSVYNCGAIGNIRYLIRPGYYGLISAGSAAFLQEYRPESGNVNEVFTDISMVGFNLKLTKLHITTSTANQSSIYSPFAGIQCGSFIDVDSCTIRGNAATPYYGGFQFFQSTTLGHMAKITNCHFVRLNFAVSLVPSTVWSGLTIPNSTDFVFENNTIDSCDNGFMITKLASNNWVRINNNVFNTNSIGIGFEAVNSSGKLNISNNKINSASAVYSWNNVGVLFDEFIFENNMCKSSYSIFSEIGKLRMVNNSFVGTTIIGSSDTCTIYNNIFYETSTVPIVYNSMTPIALNLGCTIGKTKFEHNNIYSPNITVKTQINNNFINTISQTFAQSSIGYRTYDFNPLFVSNTDLHSQSAYMKNMGKAIATVTTDIDGDVRPAGPIDIGADEIQIPFTGVWPGDANSDLQVSSQDLYSLGLHYGNHNYQRDSVSNEFVGQLCNDWNVNQIGSTVDMKFADCNGDSLIDMNDTLAINLNYNLTHLPKLNTVTTTTLTDISLQFNKALYLPGDTVKADVIIGSATNIQSNLYGASFKVAYEASKVKPNSEKMVFINSWIGNINSTKIKFANINTTQGLLDASMVRITHTDVTGFGKVGTFQFVLLDTLSSQSVDISIIDADKINIGAIITPLIPGIDSILVVPNSVVTSVNERILNSISVYPNPAADYVKIYLASNNDERYKLELSTMDGKIVFIKQVSSNSYSLNLNGLAKGVYALKIIMDDGTSKVFKLVIQ